ncbi:MAG: hypothetical protein LBT14_10385 [Treponema sp.]|nr:hypothetical protein [Treponema sp.]
MVILCVAPSFLPGQEAHAGMEEVPDAAPPLQEAADFFPVMLLWEAARSGDIHWRPDWPLTVPPDGFTVVSGRPRSITLTLEAGQYRIQRNNQGLLMEFPFFVRQELVQVHIHRDSAGKITGFMIASEIPWIIDVLAYTGAEPSRARVTTAEKVYCSRFIYATTGVSETWYDQDDAMVAVFTAPCMVFQGERRFTALEGQTLEGTMTARYDYDSWGNNVAINTVINDSSSRVSALYTGLNRPRYWKPWVQDSSPGYILQWDAGGFLVYMTGTATQDEDGVAYQYTQDARGNWTERREIPVIRHSGALVPSPQVTVQRIIEYETGVRR